MIATIDTGMSVISGHNASEAVNPIPILRLSGGSQCS